MKRKVEQLSLVVALLGVSTPVEAASLVELHWSAPEQCPSVETIQKDIERLIGESQGRPLVASVTVSQTQQQRWQVAIELSGSAAGHRELVADSCAQASRAASLIIALAASPEAALDLPADEPAPTPPPKPIPEPRVVPLKLEEKAQRPKAPPPAPTVTGVLAGVGYGSGILPTGAGQLEIGAFFRSAEFSAILSADATDISRVDYLVDVTQITGIATSTSASQPVFSRVGAHFQTLGAQLLGCVDPFRLPVRTAVCVGPRLEVLLVQGFGARENLRQKPFIPSGLVAFDFAIPLFYSLEFGVTSEMQVLVKRPQFVVDNPGAPPFQLHKPSILGVHASAYLAWKL